MYTEWKKFADAVGGSVSQSKGGRFNPDTVYRIMTPTEEVVLTWANQPERGRGTNVKAESVFRFQLKAGQERYLKVYPKDLLGSLLAGWNKNRRRTGDPELDRAYIFLADEQLPFHSVVPQLQHFHQQNRHYSFYMETEKATGNPALVIQVNELLTQNQDLLFFYAFGKQLAGVI